MTKDQIAAVLSRVQSWPRARQEDAARLLLAMEAESAEPYALSPEERADLEAALREADQSEFATSEEVAATVARHRK